MRRVAGTGCAGAKCVFDAFAGGDPFFSGKAGAVDCGSAKEHHGIVGKTAAAVPETLKKGAGQLFYGWA